jgi:hypothetical protein
MDEIKLPKKQIKTAKNRAGRKRNPNSPLAQSRMYFNGETCKAIVEFQQAPTKKERDDIYRYRILPSFEKLVENLINIHKFCQDVAEFEILRNDAIVFLYNSLQKFDPTRGSNAFSYYNVIAKNFLIIRSKQRSLQTKRNANLDDPDGLSHQEARLLEEHCTIEFHDESPDNDKPNVLLQMLDKIRLEVTTENELATINAIMHLFEHIDDIDLLGKNACLYYIREISGLNAKQLTIALQSLKKTYKQMKFNSLNSNFNLFGV